MSSEEKPPMSPDQPFCEIFDGQPEANTVSEAVQRGILNPATARSLGSYGTCQECDQSMFIRTDSEPNFPKQCANGPQPGMENLAGKVLLFSGVPVIVEHSSTISSEQ